MKTCESRWSHKMKNKGQIERRLGRMILEKKECIPGAIGSRSFIAGYTSALEWVLGIDKNE